MATAAEDYNSLFIMPRGATVISIRGTADALDNGSECRYADQVYE